MIPNNTDNKLTIGYKIGVGLLIGAVLFAIGQNAYYNIVRVNSKYRYTTALIKDICSSEAFVGRELEYMVNGYKFYDCTSVTEEIRKFKIGDSLFVKFYIKDPSVYDIIYRKVPRKTTPPNEGWLDLPSNP